MVILLGKKCSSLANLCALLSFQHGCLKGLIDAISIWQTRRITTLTLWLYFFSYSYGYMSLSCILLWLPLFISQDQDKVFHRKKEEKKRGREEGRRG